MYINLRTLFDWNEIKILLKITVPLVFTGLIEASNNFFSTLMIAHLGHNELAAAALVTSLFATLMILMWGILTSVSVLISHRHGEGNNAAVAKVFQDSMIFSIIISLPTMLLLWNAAPLLLLVGQHPQAVALARGYLHALTFAVIPDFTGIVLLQFVMGLGHTRINFYFSLVWVPTTILANYIFIFGKLGLPAFGIAGIGWGTTVSFWLTTILLLIYLIVKKTYRPYFLLSTSLNQRNEMGELIKVGLPQAGMYAIEVTYFMVLALLMGRISVLSLAANQITSQFLTQFSVVSFSVAQATTVRIGHLLGSKDLPAAQRAGYIGMLITFIFMCFIALIYWLYPEGLISLDIQVHQPNNLLLVNIIKQFMVLAAVFQIFEAVRITAFGALRGLRDTRFTMLTSILMFWLIALPLGYFLAFNLNWAGRGLWVGMIVAAIIGAVVLVKRFENQIKRYDVE